MKNHLKEMKDKLKEKHIPNMKGVVQKGQWKGIKEKFKKNKKLFMGSVVGCIAFVVILTGGIILHVKGSSKNQTETTVQSTEATIGSVRNTVEGTGTVSNGATTDVLVPTGIKVKEIKVESGDSVKKGQVLATLDEASIASELLEVKENIESVEDEIEDLSSDAQTKGTTEYLKATVLKAELEELEEAKETLTDLLDTPAIIATCSGTISSVNVSEDTEITSSSDTENGSGANTGNTNSTSGSASASNVTNTSSKATSASSVTNTSFNKAYSLMLLSTGANSKTTTENKETNSETTSEAKSDETASSTTSDDVTKTEDSTTSKETDNTTKTENSTTSSNQNTTSDSTTSTGTTKSSSSTSTKSNGTSKGTGTSSNGVSKNRGTSSAGAGNVTGTGTAGTTVSTSGTTSTGNGSSSEYSMYEAVAFSIASNKKATVSINVDELDITSIQKGQTAKVTLDAIEGQEFTGTITSVSSEASSGSSSAKYPVVITFEKTDDMKIGMTASATITIEEANNAVLIPVDALQERGNQTFVYTKKDSDGNLSGEVEVETGLSNGSNVQITSGLESGDTVYYLKMTSSKDSNSNQNIQGDRKGEMPSGNMPNGGQRGGQGGEAPSGNMGGGSDKNSNQNGSN